MTTPPTSLSERYREALLVAFDLHRAQRRKGTDIPYVAHLLGVSSLVLEDGGSEDEAIAALLHDAVEDQPRDGRTAREIRERFGERVFHIVVALTDSADGSDDRGVASWLDRKREYLERLPTKPSPVLRVAAADKLHNARAILADLESLGDALWTRFNAPKDHQLWYYRELSTAFGRAPHAPPRLVDHFQRTVRQIEVRASGA